jgi:hypothetical protein
MSTQFGPRTFWLLTTLLSQSGCSLFGIRSEETPQYQVLLKDANKEIRAYKPYVIAKTKMKDASDESRSEAFRIIAGYIFGGNEATQSIAMTAPVSQRENERVEGQKIAMTAPVTQKLSASEQNVMTFMMPSKFKLSDLPAPKDKRVEFEEVPAQTLGVIRYSGFDGEEKRQAKASELKDWLEKADSAYTINSAPIRAGYDPPWTLPFLRRIELMYELKPRSP